MGKMDTLYVRVCVFVLLDDGKTESIPNEGANFVLEK